MVPAAQVGDTVCLPVQVAAGQLVVPNSAPALSWAQLWHRWCLWPCPFALILMLEGPQSLSWL